MELNPPVHHRGENAAVSPLISLARKVQVMRALQTKYFRTPKSDPKARQDALKAAKAVEIEVDKKVDQILNEWNH